MFINTFILVSALASTLGITCAQDDTASQENYTIDVNLSGQELLKHTSQAEFSVVCTTCTINGDLSLSAGDADNLPDSKFRDLPFDYDQNWAAGVIDNFIAYFEFEINLTPTNPTNEYSVPLISGFDEGLKFPIRYALIVFELSFNPTLHGWVNSSAPVTFKYGFNFTIPSGSAVFINPDTTPQFNVTGFPNSQLTPLEYTSKSADQNDFKFEVAFRPIFGAALQIVSGPAEVADGTLFADVPQLEIDVTHVNDVTDRCEPAPAGTPENQIYDNVTKVVTTLGYDIGWTIDLPGYDDEDEYAIGQDSIIDQQCLRYSTDAGSLVALRSDTSAAIANIRRVWSSHSLLWIAGLTVLMTLL